jgi:hypothetical protein
VDSEEEEVRLVLSELLADTHEAEIKKSTFVLLQFSVLLIIVDEQIWLIW